MSTRDRAESKVIYPNRILWSRAANHSSPFSFSMLSTGVRVWPEDLVQSPTCFEPVPPCIIHTTCSPERAAIIVKQVVDIRAREGIPDWNPALIWEILPVRYLQL